MPVTRRQFLESHLAFSEAQMGQQRSALEKSALDPARRADILRSLEAQLQKRQAHARARLAARGVRPEAPQFVVVYWRWQRSRPSESLRDEFERRFDPAAVEALLDR